MERDDRLDFDKMNGLLPAIVQDVRNREVLMLGYMNRAAYQQTQREGRVTFYSRSKQRLWTKGETSGRYLHLHSMYPDCDGDTLLVWATPEGPACHTGTQTCFGDVETAHAAFLGELQAFLKQRQQDMPEGSYTTRLFQEGLNRMAQKVGEEAIETVIAAKDQALEPLHEETADLLYHLSVMLLARGTSLDAVVEVLRRRHGERSR